MFPIKDHNPSHKFPAVTIVIIVINVLVFMFELIQPDLQTFFYQYALVPRNIVWTDITSLYPLISSMFMHGGWLHIISNMWFLWIFGDNIEATLGWMRYIGFYLVCGLGASLLQYIINPSSQIPMLGASGAIAGVLGAYLVLFPKAKIETMVATFGGFLHRVNLPASFMLVYWFVIQLFSGVGSFAVSMQDQGGVAFFAHIGGFVTGWVIARQVKSRLNWYRIE